MKVLRNATGFLISASMIFGFTVTYADDIVMNTEGLSENAVIISPDDGQVSQVGNWMVSGLFDYNGEKSMYTDQLQSSVTIVPDELENGTYKIFIYKIPHMNTTEAQTYTIYHNGKVEKSAPIDFSTGDSEWVEIGTYDFYGDGEELVMLVSEDEAMCRIGSIAFELVKQGGVEENKSPEVKPEPPEPISISGEPAATPEPVSSAIDMSILKNVDKGYSVNNDNLKLYKRHTISQDELQYVYFNDVSQWSDFDVPMLEKYRKATTTVGEFIEYQPQLQLRDYVVKVNIYKYANITVDDKVRVDVMFDGKVHTQSVDFNTDKDGWFEIGTYNFTNTGAEGVRFTRVSNDTDVKTPSYMVRFDYYVDMNTKNVDAPAVEMGYSQTGNIGDTKISGYNNYSMVKSTTEKGASAVWNPSIKEPGKYIIYAHMPENASDADKNVQYQIYHDGKMDTLYADQSEKYSVESDVDRYGWYRLGEFEFSGDVNEYVKLVRTSDNGITYIDSVKFERVYYDGTVLESVIVTNRDYDGGEIIAPEITMDQKRDTMDQVPGLSPISALHAVGSGASTAYNRPYYLYNYRDDEVFNNTSITWNPCIREEGEYTIYYLAPYSIWADADIEVYHDNKIDSMVLRQDDIAPNGEQKDVDKWIRLGSAYFAGGKTDEYLVFKRCNRFSVLSFEKDLGNNGIIHQVMTTSHPYFKGASFKDVHGHWAEQDIGYMENKQLIDGVDDEKNFAPESEMTRAEFAAILVRILKLDEIPAVESYTDVSEGAWYTGYIGAAKNAGLFYGIPVSGNNIYPDAKITREEALQMVSNGIDYSGRYLNVYNFFDNAVEELDGYDDASMIGKWAIDGVARALRLEIVEGYDDNTIRPKEMITRAEATKLLRNFLDLAVNSGPPKDNDWELTMGDEFNGETFDWSKWDTESYVRFAGLSARWPENITVKDGKLLMYNSYDNRKVPFSAASITFKERQQYGFFEARYKYPKCYGGHSSFWSSGKYEDVLYGDFNYNEGTYPSLVSNNNYFLDEEAEVPLVTDPSQTTKARVHDWRAETNLADDFHTYSGYAYPEYIAYGFDGEWTHKVENFQQYYGYVDNPKIDIPYDFILSTVITSFDGPIDKNNIDGTYMEVDWMRIYAKKSFEPQIREMYDDTPTNTPVISFTKQMDMASITPAMIDVDNDAPEFEIKVISPTRIQLVFSGELQSDTMYTVTLKPGIRDSLGNETTNDMTAVFRSE